MDDHGARARRLRSRESAPDALFSGGSTPGLRGWLDRTDSYGFVLVLQVLLIWVLMPFLGSERWASTPATVVFFVTTLIAAHTSEVGRRWFLAVCGLSAALLVVDVTGASIDDLDVRAIAGTGFGLLLAAMAFVVMRRVLHHRTISSRTLAGAVAAYLFMASPSPAWRRRSRCATHRATPRPTASPTSPRCSTTRSSRRRRSATATSCRSATWRGPSRPSRRSSGRSTW